MYVGLGEILPGGVSYASRDSSAAGIVEIARTQWDAFKAGTTVGNNWTEFQAAVALGWVPDTVEGFDRFQYYFTGGADVRATLPEFAGWTMAMNGAQTIRNGDPDYWGRLGWRTPAGAIPQTRSEAAAAWTVVAMDAARVYGTRFGADYATAFLNAFNRFLPQYLAGVNLTQPLAPAAPVVPQVDPNIRPGVQMVFAATTGGNIDTGNVGLRTLTGFRRVQVYTGLLPEGGNVRYGPWQPTPQVFVVRDDPWLVSQHVADGWWGLVPASHGQAPQEGWATQLPSEVAEILNYWTQGPAKDAAVTASERQLVSWLQSLGVAIAPPLWAQPAQTRVGGFDVPTWTPTPTGEPPKVALVDGKLVGPSGTVLTTGQVKAVLPHYDPGPIALPPPIPASGGSGDAWTDATAPASGSSASGAGKPFPWLLVGLGALVFLGKRRGSS